MQSNHRPERYLGHTCLAIAVALASCEGSPRFIGSSFRAETPEDLAAQIVPVFSERIQGTGILLGPSSLLTCRHVLDAKPQRIRLGDSWREIEVSNRGRGMGWAQDWALCRPRDGAFGIESTIGSPRFDFERPLDDGTPIWLIGFRSESIAARTVLAGTVYNPPADWRLPRDVSYVEVHRDREDADLGMSGAAAIVLDENGAGPVIVGLLIGRAHVVVNDIPVAYPRVIARPRSLTPASLAIE